MHFKLIYYISIDLFTAIIFVEFPTEPPGFSTLRQVIEEARSCENEMTNMFNSLQMITRKEYHRLQNKVHIFHHSTLF